MLNTVELKQSPEVKRVVNAAFPLYRKAKAWLSVFPEGGVNVNSYWDGGSRAEYAVVNLATGDRLQLPTSTHPYFDVHGTENSEVVSVDARGNITLKAIPEGFALVAAGTFCGKQATAHVYLHAANFAKLLPSAA